MKIGVITLPFGPNYGWLMQVYAMQKVLEKLGHDVVLISRKWDISDANSGLFVKIMRPIYYNINCGGIYRFYKKNIKKTKIYRSNEELQNVVNDYNLDAIIVGSDQVWRIEDTRGVGYNFFLDFADDVLKISYAASFGNDNWQGTNEDNKIISKLLDSFSGISVREESGVDICSKFFDKKAECVLDPTLLLTYDDYEKILPRVDRKQKGFLATYILDPTQEKDFFVASVSHSKDLKKDSLYIKNRTSRFHVYKPIENWLMKIRDADFVIVDSFHGMVFSIIFKKQFIAIANQKRGNTRFLNIMRSLDLEDKLIYDFGETELQKTKEIIDYNKVYKLLEVRKCQSYDFLMKSLSNIHI